MSDGRWAIVAATFYRELADRLVAGAQRAFGGGAAVYEVPGAFELPPAALALAQSGRYEGIACVGAVIRGETDHYDYVCAEAARGIQDVQLRTGLPCGFGVLTCDTYEQALARSGEGTRDAGAHAAHAAMAVAALQRRVAAG